MRKFNSVSIISNKFYDKFKYFCEIPFDALKGELKAIEEFEKVVDKCIADDFDYTIEFYGTKPLPKGDPKQILID